MVKAVSRGTSNKAKDQPFRARRANHSVTPEVERLLMEGYARGTAGKTKAIQAAQKLQPELTKSALWKQAQKLKIASRRAKTPPWERWQVRMVRDLMGEVSTAEIAARVDRPVGSVSGKAKAMHWSLRLRNGYSVRQAAWDLMVSHHKIRALIREESLEVEKKRITEESYGKFCRIRPRQVSVEALLPDEWKVLIDVVREPGMHSVRDLALVYVLGDGGLAGKEVAAVRLGDIDWLSSDSAAIRLDQGKSREPRLVTLSGGAGRALRAYHSLRGGERSALLFVDDSGSAMSTQSIDSMLSRLADRAQIERIGVTSRTLRHTFAMNYLNRYPGKTKQEKAATLLKLSRLLGHFSIHTVQLYVDNPRSKPIGSGRRVVEKTASEADADEL